MGRTELGKVTRAVRVAMGTAYPYDETRVRGGVEAAALYLVHGLVGRKGIDLHVVSCTPAVKSSVTERRHGATFHWIPGGERMGALRAATLDALRVRRAYASIRPDVIHAQDGSAYGVGAPRSTPMILTIHGVEVYVPQTRRLRHYRGLRGLYRRSAERWMIEESLSRARALVSIAGDYVPRIIGKCRLGDRPVFKIANPIADRFWEIDPDKPGSGSRILCVGEITELKNAIGLVRALAQVVKQVPNAELQFAGGIGEPRYYALVQEEIAQHGLGSSVRFLGRLSQSQLMDAYARSRVVALASIQETAPMSIAQGMAAARAVVAAGVGGVSWLVTDGRSGHVVDPGDVNAMGSRIVELLRDEAGRLRMGRLAREEATTRFSSRSVAQETEALYLQVLS